MEVDETVVAFHHDAIRENSQTGAAPDFFGGEGGFKNPVPIRPGKYYCYENCYRATIRQVLTIGCTKNGLVWRRNRKSKH